MPFHRGPSTSFGRWSSSSSPCGINPRPGRPALGSAWRSTSRPPRGSRPKLVVEESAAFWLQPGGDLSLDSLISRRGVGCRGSPSLRASPEARVLAARHPHPEKGGSGDEHGCCCPAPGIRISTPGSRCTTASRRSKPSTECTRTRCCGRSTVPTMSSSRTHSTRPESARAFFEMTELKDAMSGAGVDTGSLEIKDTSTRSRAARWSARRESVSRVASHRGRGPAHLLPCPARNSSNETNATTPPDATALDSLPSNLRVHVVGAGPVGLLLTALLQSMEGFSVRLYEKRREYTRTRMVQLAPYLVADSVESYRADAIDGDSVEAIFDPPELEQGLAFRQSIPSDLSALLRTGRWGSARSTPSSAPSAI